MYIDSVLVENIKCFKGKHTISFKRNDGSHAGWTVLAGRNGTGKTTFLKSVAYAVLSTSAFTADTQKFSHVSGLSGFGRVRVETFPLTKKDFGIIFGMRGYDWLKFEREGVWRLEDVLFFLGYGVPRTTSPYIGTPYKEDDVKSWVESLMSDDVGLWDSLLWLQHLQFRAIEGHADAAQLRDDVIALLNDGLLPDKSRIEKVNSDGVWIVRDGFELPLELASDGYRAMIALIVDMAHKLSVRFKGLDLQRDARGHMSCPHPAVVLIDEIDAHLHVEWQQRIGFWLKRHFPKIQFIVTTHSPFVCQAADRRGIIRLPAPGEDRTIEHVSEETWKTLVRGGIDQAVMTDLFGLGHPHSDETEALQDELADLQSKALRGDDLTPEEEARAEELMGQLSGDLTTQVDVAMKAVGVRHAED